MRWNRDIFITGTGTWLAELQPVAAAVEAGLVGEEHQNLGYESIAVDEGGTAAPDMAVFAGRTALSRSGLATEEFGLHLHASMWYQGLDLWSPARYIASRTSGSQAVAYQIDQRSSGGMGALHLAAAYLEAGVTSAAMITTGDRFAPPAVDRWNSYLQTLLGDGGTALTLSTRTGFARLISTVAVADNDLERWDRGATQFASRPGEEVPADVLKRALQHAASPESEGDWQTWTESIARTSEQALADAGTDREDISRAVLPFVHRGGGQKEMEDVLGFTEEQTVWREFGSRVGHLGSGDQLAGLNHLIEQKAVLPGDRVLLFGLGVGFSYSAAVLEILELPSW